MLKGLVVFGLTRRPIVLLCLLVFIGAGIAAFFKLNIEAYPNPAPVILEITAQSAGLSAEEMERYFTVPMEVGLSTTPGVDIIRSTSFYGLSFVRVTFKYGIDFYFALQQAALSLQQNVNLPNGVMPQIQGSSLVGEVFRYQLVGPPAVAAAPKTEQTRTDPIKVGGDVVLAQHAEVIRALGKRVVHDVIESAGG